MPKFTLQQRNLEKKDLTNAIQLGLAESFKARISVLLSLYGLPTVFYFLQEILQPLTLQQRWWASGLLWDVDIHEDIAERLCWDVLLDFFDNHALVPGTDYYVDESRELYLQSKGAKVFKKFCHTVVIASSATNSIKFSTTS